ncbi:MAG: stage V sporulation protein AC [Eubacteriales bacterium]
MGVNKESYKKFADQNAEKSPLLKDCVKAFLIGGLICLLGQALFTLYTECGLSEQTVKSTVSVSLIFLTALLTGFGLFDKIAKHAGAGTLVPITGFANSVVAPAIDNKAEGWILGLGAKIFIIAGPVILYGTLASAIYGAIYYICTLF